MSEETAVGVVTGASRGLGASMAIDLARTGARLALISRDAEALETVANQARAAGATDVMVLPENLCDPRAPERVVGAVMERWGRLDWLVNNAGDTKRGNFMDLLDEDHLSGFELKYHATVRFCRAALPHMAPETGSIVNISGIGALTPEPDFTIGGPVNSAIINFSKALSKRADAPRVNVVCPGHIKTDRLARRISAFAEAQGLSQEEAALRMQKTSGIERYGNPEDVASIVTFLCSDRAAYVRGAVLTVDGGATPGI